MNTTSDFLGHPKGLFVCFATEMWERFSYYGMRALLILYLTKHWEFSDATSYLIYGAYTSLVYIMPVFGGMLADQILGSKKAVTYGAILLVLGHTGMAIESNQQIFYLSLALIVSGVGFLKPNISTMVGSLYAEGDPRRDSGFTIFYMGINIGAFSASLLCGYLGETYGWAYGFGAAGVGMLLGLIIFLWGQKYLQGLAEPPSEKYKETSMGISYEYWAYISGIFMVLGSWFLVQNQEVVGTLLGGFGAICIAIWLMYALFKCSPEERDRLIVVGILILFSLIFWALFEQAGSSLNILTDRGVDRSIFGWVVPASMFQSLNAGFIFTLAPFFAIHQEFKQE
jgi:POT family proton-dependent oligopeptide transporter